MGIDCQNYYGYGVAPKTGYEIVQKKKKNDSSLFAYMNAGLNIPKDGTTLAYMNALNGPTGSIFDSKVNGKSSRKLA